MLTGRRLLEVWGDPISHSLSPRLHTAGYGALGLDWRYGRRQVGPQAFAATLKSLPPSYRGLSLTMPLKRCAFEIADTRDEPARRAGVVNTLLLTDSGIHGFNTDVGGIAADLRAHGIAGVNIARIVGAGSTATSALLALHELGAEDIEIRARHPDAARGLEELGAHLGMRVHAEHLAGPAGVVTHAAAGADATGCGPVEVTVAALPGGARLEERTATALAEGGGMLYDVVYAPWPTDLARAWHARGGHVVRGIGMLVQQALLQVRVFVGGDPQTPLAGEAEVQAVMRAAVADA